MLHRFHHYLATYLERNGLRVQQEIHANLFSLVAVLYCLAAHFVLLIFHGLMGDGLFVGLNIASILVYLVLFILHHQKRYVAVFVLLVAEVCLYASITVVFIGLSTYVVLYYMLAAVMQIVNPYLPIRYRRGVLIGIVLLNLAALFYGFTHAPLAVRGELYINTLVFINVAVMYIGIIAQLYFNALIKSLMERLDRMKMQELADLANTDPLTGLYNRRYANYLIRYISSVQAEDKGPIPYCLVMLDIDRFKLVNDRYGHAVGDEVLIYLAEFLRLNLRRQDTIFRWGGEEFLIVLENVVPETAYSIMDILRSRFEKTPVRAGGITLQITFTAGLAALDKDNFAESLAEADKNLYLGKDRGRNLIVG